MLCVCDILLGLILDGFVMLAKLMDVCSGQTPSEADFNLLDTARKVDVYGLHLFAAHVCSCRF